MKQDLIDDSKVSMIGLIFWKRKTASNEEKQEVMDNMINILSDQTLLDIFKEDDEN
jgi:hypothetical protein